MTQLGLNSASSEYADNFVAHSDRLRDLYDNAVLLGAPALSPGICATLTFVARSVDAKAVVVIGADNGLSGLSLYSGMHPGGILTTIGTESDWQEDARAAYVGQGISDNRIRLIAGEPLEVLPKLRDAAYDLVFIQGNKLEYVEYVAQAERLLRPGGVVALNSALWQNLVADEDNEDDETVIIREALQYVVESEQFTPTLIPLGDGLLLAAHN